MKLFLIVVLTCCFSLQSFSQDTNDFYINSIRIEYNFLGRVTRNATLPSLVRNSEFYQFHFGDFGVPERIINKKYTSTQFGINLGFRFDSYSKKNNHELLIGVGYQNSGEYSDRVRRFNSSGDSGITNSAVITIDQEYREIYLNSVWLFKSKGKYFSVHTGLGFNFAFSNPNYTVTEFENQVQRNQYTIKNGINTYYNFYVPMGFEIKGEAMILGFDYSVRFDDHFFSGASFSLGYKL